MWNGEFKRMSVGGMHKRLHSPKVLEVDDEEDPGVEDWEMLAARGSRMTDRLLQMLNNYCTIKSKKQHCLYLSDCREFFADAELYIAIERKLRQHYGDSIDVIKSVGGTLLVDMACRTISDEKSTKTVRDTSRIEMNPRLDVQTIDEGVLRFVLAGVMAHEGVDNSGHWIFYSKINDTQYLRIDDDKKCSVLDHDNLQRKCGGNPKKAAIQELSKVLVYERE